jgi:tetratricopeptide (TPR) repeat protein
VNPVPGLANLHDDVLAHIVSSPGIRAALQAKELEREALAFESQQKTFEAIDSFQRAIELNPRDGAIRRSLAMLRTRLGIRYAADHAINAAHNNLRAAVETDTTYALGFANLGTLLRDLGPPEYALSTTNQAILLEPDDDLAWVQLGSIQRKSGDLSGALESFKKAMDLNPQNASAASEWIDAKLALDAAPDFVGAVEFLQRYLDLEPENEDLMYRIGRYRDAMRRQHASSEALPPPATSADSSAR